MPGNLLRFKIFDVGKTQSDVLLFAIAGQRIRHREVNFRAKFRKYAVKIIFIDVDFSLSDKGRFSLP